MEEILGYMRDYPIGTFLVVNVLISIILSMKVLYATTPAYKMDYNTASLGEKVQLIYGLFGYVSKYATPEGQKYRFKLLISGLLYVVLMVLV